MAKFQSFESWVKDLESKCQKVNKEASDEYYDFLEKKLRTNYKRIIDIFYKSYNPRFYKRRDSLYNLLRIKVGQNGLSYDFDPSKIEMRDGYSGENGLYKTVFLQGYHGGAYISDAKKFLVPWTEPRYEYDGNPEPWKTPKPWDRSKNVKHGWEPAERSVSPYRLWKSFIDKYNSGQAQEDYDEIIVRVAKKYF